jgi:hypothetical protein
LRLPTTKLMEIESSNPWEIIRTLSNSLLFKPNELILQFVYSLERQALSNIKSNLKHAGYLLSPPRQSWVHRNGYSLNFSTLHRYICYCFTFLSQALL